MDLWLLRKKVQELGGYDAVRLVTYMGVFCFPK